MLWLSVALVLRAAPIPLEVPPAKAVSLEEALALARAQHPALEASRQRVAAAQAEVDAVSALWLPTAGLAAELVGATANNSTATVLSTSAVDLPRIGSTKVTATPDFAPSATSLVAVGLRQLVWDFGRQGAQGKVAQAQAAAEQARSSRTALGLDFDVTRAFQAVLAARAVLEASEQAYARVVTHRDFAKVAVDAQLRPPIEFTRAEADVSRAELGRLRALSAVTAARLQLAAAVGGADLQLDARGALRPPEPPPSLEQARA
ncbi:MAG: TolC family protein, partial [Myxococcaceae bacterium]|nr:TolC family protein [Myxococcaceae bacterium]